MNYMKLDAITNMLNMLFQPRLYSQTNVKDVNIYFDVFKNNEIVYHTRYHINDLLPMSEFDLFQTLFNQLNVIDGGTYKSL